MPGGLHFADEVLPRVTLGKSTEEKVEGILTFLYELTDQLRYLFENTELDAFTTEALAKEIRKQLTGTLDQQQEEVRLYLGSGAYYSFRADGIFYTSEGEIKQVIAV